VQVVSIHRRGRQWRVAEPGDTGGEGSGAEGKLPPRLQLARVHAESENLVVTLQGNIHEIGHLCLTFFDYAFLPY